MNWRDLPPLSALRAFAAFSQTGSVVAAGDALGVSHAAISQQLRSLEQHLNVVLLDRSGRAMRLTAQGDALAQAVQAGFARMIETSQQISDQSNARPLHISTTPTFAASWLMPRLSKFRAAHGDIDLMIDPTPSLISLEASGIEVALRYGAGPWPGLDAQLLLRSPMVVVAAPALVGTGPMPDLDALSDLPWLEEVGTSESTRWLQERGIIADKKRHLIQVPGNLLLDGVRDGQGVAVAVHAFVARDIAAGRLRELYREDSGQTGYHVVTRPGVQRPALKQFVKWILREAAEG